MAAAWRRLRPEAHPRPTIVPMEHVQTISATIQLDDAGADIAAGGAELERWLRFYLISRIPGATGGPDRLSGDPVHPSDTGDPSDDPSKRPAHAPSNEHLLSDLIGCTVQNADGDNLGKVLDVSAEPVPTHGPAGRLSITSVLFGRRRLGAEMGYLSQLDQGPRIVAASIRWWQREVRAVRWSEVDNIDWANHTVVLTRSADPARRATRAD